MNDEFTYGNRHSRPGFGCWKSKTTASEFLKQQWIEEFNIYSFDKDDMQTFIDQVCKEQRELCLHAALNALSSEEFNAIINAPKPDGL